MRWCSFLVCGANSKIISASYRHAPKLRHSCEWQSRLQSAGPTSSTRRRLAAMTMARMLLTATATAKAVARLRRRSVEITRYANLGYTQ
eukprot:6212759-Pleurochrysis_carterae.AAC.1